MALAPLTQSLAQFKVSAPAAPTAPATGSKPPISAFQNSNVDLSQHPALVAVASALHQKILQGVPANDLGRQQLVNYLKANVNKVGGTSAAENVNNFVQALPQAAQDTVGNALIAPAARLGVGTFDLGSDAITAAKGQPLPANLLPSRNLPLGIGTVTPSNPDTPGGALKVASDAFQTGGTAMAATDLAGQGVDAVQAANKAAIDANAAKADTAAVTKLQETIAPKITSKETQAIINEGRLTRGDSSALFGKQPDIVTQSENVQQAAQVIHQNIPNAAQMNDAQLSNALNTKIGETAQSLKPQMEATPIHPDTVEKAQETWQSLKTEQQGRPEFLDNKAGNAAFQNKFQNYLQEALDGKNMNDVWDPRKAYDASVPASVKNATTSSPPQFQVRKTMWLENRAILNSMINDSSTGLGTQSQQAFSDMSHMYDAQQNIAAKAKIDTTGAPGPLSKSTVLKWGLGAGATLFGLHKLGL
jgi:hypothetical protein